VHDREHSVRIPPVARRLVRQRDAHGRQIALGDAGETRREEDGDVDAVDRLARGLPAVPRRPREVVHVGLHVPLDEASALLPPLDGRARGADDVPGRDVEGHIVRAEVRIELGQMVKREVRPCPGRFEARHLRKPLAHHVESSAIAGPLDDGRQLVVECHVEIDALARGHRARQGHARVRLVVVPRALELQSRQEVRGPADGCAQREARQVDPSPVLRRSAAASPHALAQEGRAVVLERVEIEVYPELARGLRARVSPVDRPPAVYRVRRRIERCSQRVVDHVLRVHA